MLVAGARVPAWMSSFTTLLIATPLMRAVERSELPRKGA